MIQKLGTQIIISTSSSSHYMERFSATVRPPKTDDISQNSLNFWLAVKF